MDSISPKARLTETAYRDNRTAEIIPTGMGWSKGRNRALDEYVTYGFIDSDGMFLNRFDAYHRAVETGQFSIEMTLKNPNMGLSADDLRNFGKSPEFGTLCDKLKYLADLAKAVDDGFKEK